MKRFTTLCLALLALAATAVPAGAAVRLDRGERNLVRLINGVRAQHGLGAVRPSWPLNRAAESHSRDMQRTGGFDHASSNGTPFHVRVQRFVGRVTVGETIALLRGHPRPAPVVVRMWLESPPHRAILLDGDFSRIGVARRGGLWTADFASAR